MPDPIAPYAPRPLLAEVDAGRAPSVPTREPFSADHASFDYVTITVGIGALFGASLSATVDRDGHVYLATAIGAGFGPTIATVSLVAGIIVDESRGAAGAPPIIEGDSVNGSVAYGPSVGVTSYPGGTAIEIGIGMPQIGVSFEHAWEIR